ncbi:hypothetical protein COLO4_13791 [Corchorus olitorius]|uniref:Uncharacterized protein n=1 Tax=Corchorus olitorius TaxID=93759 RepID=A0A1R3JUV7_9ROSI|nr:hypothetical protein COLO4_13791 [Corchorus olitorius]
MRLAEKKHGFFGFQLVSEARDKVSAMGYERLAVLLIANLNPPSNGT